MASVTCTKCGALLKTKVPVAAGKKLKCSKCEKVFVVEEEEEEKVEGEETPVDEDAGEDEEEKKPLKKRKAQEEEDADDQDGEDEEEKPKKKTKGKQDAKKGSPVILLAGAAVVVLLLCLAGGGAGGWYFFLREPGGKKDQVAKTQALAPVDKDADKKDKDADKKEKKEPEPKKEDGLKPDFTLTVEQMTTELRANHKATAAKYKGKRLEISGELDYFGPGSISMYGVLGKDDLPFSVMCDFAQKDEGKVHRLSRKQKIKATGKAEIPARDTFVILRDSTIVELEPSKLVMMMFPEVAEILDGGGKLLAKPREHGVLVKGTVVETVPNKKNPGSHFIYLESPGKTRYPLLVFGLPKGGPPQKGQIIEGSLRDEFFQDPDTNERNAIVYLLSVK